jgi:hypothetical protein
MARYAPRAVTAARRWLAGARTITSVKPATPSSPQLSEGLLKGSGSPRFICSPYPVRGFAALRLAGISGSDDGMVSRPAHPRDDGGQDRAPAWPCRSRRNVCRRQAQAGSEISACKGRPSGLANGYARSEPRRSAKFFCILNGFVRVRQKMAIRYRKKTTLPTNCRGNYCAALNSCANARQQ